jgi:phosphoenolpyruvate carboxylase
MNREQAAENFELIARMLEEILCLKLLRTPPAGAASEVAQTMTEMAGSFALDALLAKRPGDFAQLSAQFAGWAPLHYALSNAATCLAAADLDVMREYTALVEDAGTRHRIFSAIAVEFECTHLMLERVYGGSLAARRPNIHASLEKRAAPLRVLHREQIALLREWRGLRACAAGRRRRRPS